MGIRFYIPIYALTLLLSAALLFSIQPMFSKLILPLLGGTPQVWNTAMLFFQSCLLAGYAYAHASSRFLPAKFQAVLHVALLIIFIGVLPFAIPEGWSPPREEDPTFWQLSLMLITVGGPFFVLSGSAPILQRWFSYSSHPDADNPYFLYGASNLGSMSSLLLYPFLIEPYLNLREQFDGWMYGYFGLIFMVVLSALLIVKIAPKTKTAENNMASKIQRVSWKQRFGWLILAFIPSSLMLGVTTFVTTDVASVPLLWIIPLSIYVGTFVLVFARKPIFSETFILNAFTTLIIILVFQLIYFALTPDIVFLTLAFHMVLFFFAALLCHSTLVKLRPAPAFLTEFYLIMSLGGALGGLFNAIIAPRFLVQPIEYALVLGLAVLVRFANIPEYNFYRNAQSFFSEIRKRGVDFIFTANTALIFLAIVLGIFAFSIPNTVFVQFIAFLLCIVLTFMFRTRWTFAAACLFILFLFPPGIYWSPHSSKIPILQGRNFFGVYRVHDTPSGLRVLMHGTTDHGSQSLDDQYKLIPLSYYNPNGPVGDVLGYMDTIAGEQDIGVIGLGAGSMACYPKEGRHFDFFEIDPDIAKIAQDPQYFTFLTDCGSPYDIILGDGRLTIQEQEDRKYDLLVLDAFSSDNIPVHVITLEAIETYTQKTKEDGLIIYNISNNYVDLEPVLSLAAEELGYYGVAKIDPGGIAFKNTKYYAAHYFAMTKSPEILKMLENKGWSTGLTRDSVKPWTDHFSNIVSVLGNKSGGIRFLELQKKMTTTEETDADF